MFPISPAAVKPAAKAFVNLVGGATGPDEITSGEDRVRVGSELDSKPTKRRIKTTNTLDSSRYRSSESDLAAVRWWCRMYAECTDLDQETKVR